MPRLRGLRNEPLEPPSSAFRPPAGNVIVFETLRGPSRRGWKNGASCAGGPDAAGGSQPGGARLLERSGRSSMRRRLSEAGSGLPDAGCSRAAGATLRALALRPGERALDIGSRTGPAGCRDGPGGRPVRSRGCAYARWQRQHATPWANADVTIPSIRERVAFVKADPAALPFPGWRVRRRQSLLRCTSTSPTSRPRTPSCAESLQHTAAERSSSIPTRIRSSGTATDQERIRSAPDRLDEALCRPPPTRARSPGNSRMPPSLQLRHRDVLVLPRLRATTLIPSAWPTARSSSTSPSPDTR